MSLAAHGSDDILAVRPRPRDLHGLLMQALRMVMVVTCFTAAGAIVLGIRLYAFLPALHR